MTHRERILTALQHGIPDRIPMGIHFTHSKYEEFVERTGQTNPSKYFELDYRGVPIIAPRQLPDFSPYFQNRVPDWPNMSTPDFCLIPFQGSGSYFVMGEHRTAMNEWGEYRVYDERFDYHHKIAPFGQKSCTVKDIEAYPFPDLTAEYRYEGLTDMVRKIHERNLAAVLSWEMTIFEKAWRIRGLEEMMMDFIMHPDVVECLLDRVAEQTGYLARRYAEAGVDIIQLGDDVGSQHGMLISPKVWRQFLKPRMAKLIAGIKAANPDVLVFYHTDGIVDPVIPDFIEIGIDILNPVQPECMDIGALKARYGSHLSFWGGIGVQSTLPFGTPEEVREAVRNVIAQAGQEGGLLIAPAHVIEPDVPWENVEAFVQAVRDFGPY